MNSTSENEYLFTSESVTEGHPDKIADPISDGALDPLLKAAADLVGPQTGSPAGRRAQGGDRSLPAPRRQDAGHRALFGRTSSGGGQAADLHPAPRRRRVADQGGPVGARDRAGAAARAL